MQPNMLKLFSLLLWIGVLAGLGYLVLLHPTTTPATQVAAVAVATPAIDPIEAALRSMTVEEKIGQLLVAGHWRGSDYIHTSNLIRAYNLGGVIIMNTPTEHVAEIPTWTSVWQANTDIPLMISIDQEGGSVTRIKADQYIQTGQSDITDSQEALAVATERGAELHSLGINTNLAPVLEQSVNPFAFLYERTFRDPATIGALGQAMVVGYRQENVVAVPKHFPGHSDTPTDSHVELPIIDIATSDFSEHAKHFARVIEFAEPEAIMTAHVMLPALDATYPATLSPVLLTDKLRTEIGFTGVIITDDMTMGAITNTYEPAAAALRAITAGADMILFAAEPNQVIETTTLLQAAVADGRLTEARLDESVRRILTMKAVY